MKFLNTEQAKQVHHLQNQLMFYNIIVILIYFVPLLVWILMQGMENVKIVNVQQAKELTTSTITKKGSMNQYLFLVMLL